MEDPSSEESKVLAQELLEKVAKGDITHKEAVMDTRNPSILDWAIRRIGNQSKQRPTISHISCQGPRSLAITQMPLSLAQNLVLLRFFPTINTWAREKPSCSRMGRHVDLSSLCLSNVGVYLCSSRARMP